MATKVIFDGDNKRIIIKPGVTYIDVKTDLYSDWKEWAMYTGSQYLSALRTTGGDPLPGGQAVGGFYFLTNNWKLIPSGTIPDTDIVIDGNLFTEDGSSIIITSGTSVQLVKQIVSSLALVNEVSTGGGLTPTQDTYLSSTYAMSGQTTSSLSALHVTASSIQSDLTIVSGGIYDIRSDLVTVNTDLDTANANILTVSGAVSQVQWTLNNTGGSLTPTQATMLLEMYNLLGLDPTKPLVVSPTSRTAGAVTQSIAQTGNTVTVTRT